MTASIDARAHILVVEDDVDVRESIVEVLEDAGYTVAVAADGKQALSSLQSRSPRPDLILLDLMMPNMNGFQFREEQLRSPEHAEIPVAVMSADTQARESAARMKVAAFVPKPFKVKALLDLIRNVVGAQGAAAAP